MESIQPRSHMEVEKTVNEFVENFGGELIEPIISKNFQGKGKGKRPLNADYFFRERTVVAELKCLEKNYLHDRKVGEKLNRMRKRWEKEGLLRPEHMKGGMFQTKDLPRQCGLEMFKVLKTPTQEAVKKANEQIRETKKYFGVPEAKGLLILANDGNYSVDPEFMMRILSNLLKSSYTSIDSFIFFTLNIRFHAPQIDNQFNVWISGASNNPSSNAVDPEFLHEIRV